MVFDATDRGIKLPSVGSDGTSSGRVGLTPVWWVGARLHRVTARADAVLGARSWDEALRWAVRVSQERGGTKIASLQAWGHGGWGFMTIGDGRLDASALEPEHALALALDALRAALAGPHALVWLRCCSAFGHHGRHFAAALARRLGCTVAGHTHVIGFLQSGLHVLAPGEEPAWDPREGVLERDGVPTCALGSSVRAPSTVTALRATLPRRARDRS